MNEFEQEDRIVYEAWGCLQCFAERDKECPQHLRDSVKEYQQRIKEARAMRSPSSTSGG